MRLTRRSSSISKSLSVGTPGSEATVSRSRASSSVVMPAEASALCIALRRVGDDLAVVRFKASGTRLASLDKPERQRISRPDGARGPPGPVAVVIQATVEADIAGVMFTRDPAPVPLNA
jgi:hypothetical protein